MRTREEFEEMFKVVGAILENPDNEDDEATQAVYETLRWALREVDMAAALAYLPEP